MHPVGLEFLQRVKVGSSVLAVLNFAVEHLAGVPVLLSRLILEAFRTLVAYKFCIIQLLHHQAVNIFSNVYFAFAAGASAIGSLPLSEALRADQLVAVGAFFGLFNHELADSAVEELAKSTHCLPRAQLFLQIGTLRQKRLL